MMTQLSPGSKAQLRRYVEGQLSISELAEWLVQMEYDPDLTREERDALAQVRLTLMEASEGLRPKDDILANVSAVLALSQPQTPLIVRRSGSATSWQLESVSTTNEPRVQHVGISA